jgi:hypothetical protein
MKSCSGIRSLKSRVTVRYIYCCCSAWEAFILDKCYRYIHFYICWWYHFLLWYCCWKRVQHFSVWKIISFRWLRRVWKACWCCSFGTVIHDTCYRHYHSRVLDLMHHFRRCIGGGAGCIIYLFV